MPATDSLEQNNEKKGERAKRAAMLSFSLRAKRADLYILSRFHLRYCIATGFYEKNK